MILEDETPLLMFAEAVLQDAGYETKSAQTVAEAQALTRSSALFDLLFTDIQLGDRPDAGLLVGRMVLAARSGTPVLYTSGRALKPEGAFLPKPYTAQQLKDAVALLLSANRTDKLAPARDCRT